MRVNFSMHDCHVACSSLHTCGPYGSQHPLPFGPQHPLPQWFATRSVSESTVMHSAGEHHCVSPDPAVHCVQDKRISFDEWPNWKAKMPFGTMPVLEVDGKMIAQMAAIGKNVSRAYVAVQCCLSCYKLCYVFTEARLVGLAPTWRQHVAHGTYKAAPVLEVSAHTVLVARLRGIWECLI